MSPDQQYINTIKEQLSLLSQDRSTKSTLIDFIESLLNALQSEPKREEALKTLNKFVSEYRCQGDMTGY